MKKLILSPLFLLMLFSITVAQQYDFKKGDSYTVTTSVDQIITQMMMGQEMEITNQVETVEKYEISSVENGIFTIKVTSLSNKTTAGSPQGTVTMSSDGTSTTDLTMKAITGVEFSFKMDRSGRVLEVIGTEAAQAHVKNTLEGTPLAQSISQISSAYTEENLTSNLDTKFNIYPESPASEWTKEKNLTLNNMPVSLTSDYSLSGNEITTDGTLIISGKGAFNGMQLDMDMEGTQKGSYIINNESGAILSSESETEMNGSVSTQGITIPMYITSTTKTTMAKN
ncbi:MAG: DUF6263 family protein [Balneola sp.]